jgi:hypothetical protein
MRRFHSKTETDAEAEIAAGITGDLRTTLGSSHRATPSVREPR